VAQIQSNARKRRLKPGEVLVRRLGKKVERRKINRVEEVYLHYTEGTPDVGFARFDEKQGALVPVVIERSE
jgi:hypothetical protein